MPEQTPLQAGTTSTSSSDRAVPPMPSEVTSVRAGRLAAGGIWHRATMALRKMMRRTPR
jgi:hypothetical protein